ncbi:uncharacterized protein LOC116141679 [Pistacia vera]|uniref:uncharacterized protein LOC116141679 n=1 Tax=Pistacia vera TaxID=55513 RepID=UPI00126378EE|nr:uncharacterized protein LOC116141679 [Pistacia vera]
MDSGATDHVTVDLNHLHISKNYNGDILCVPKITKNLLSISKFTKDNNVIVEFDANCCIVKDKSTGAMLLQGDLKGGLYQLNYLPIQTSSSPFMTKNQISSQLASINSVTNIKPVCFDSQNHSMCCNKTISSLESNSCLKGPSDVSSVVLNNESCYQPVLSESCVTNGSQCISSIDNKTKDDRFMIFDSTTTFPPSDCSQASANFTVSTGVLDNSTLNKSYASSVVSHVALASSNMPPMVTKAKSAAWLQLETSNQDDIHLAYLLDRSATPEQKFKSLVTHNPDDIHLAFLVDGSEAPEPETKSVSNALSSSNWKAAIQSKFDALIHNNTWTLVPSSSDMNVAPRTWFEKLKSALQQKGFQNSISDSILFTLQQASGSTYVLVYVDDILITSSDAIFITQLMKDLNNDFALNTLGSLKYFLGLEATRTFVGIHLKQSK